MPKRKRLPSVRSVENAIQAARERTYAVRRELDEAADRALSEAAMAAAHAREKAAYEELARLEGELILAKLRQQNEPPNSVRAAGGGRTSPR
jgi:hypothetical protein